MKKFFMISLSGIIIILLSAAVLIPESKAQNSNSQEFSPSRYAIIAADVNVFSPQMGRSNERQSIIVKLDTITGRSWILQLDVAGGNDPKVRYSMWRELGGIRR